MASIVLLLGAAVQSAPISSSSLDDLMALSGINDQMGDYPELLSAGVLDGVGQAQARRPAAAAFYAAARRAVDDTIRSSDFVAPVRAALQARLSEEDALELLAWLRSDLGLRITAAEKAVGTPAAVREMQRRAQALMLSEERVAIAQEMNRTLGTTDVLMDMQQASVRAVIDSSLVADMNDRDKEELVAEFARTRAQRRATLEQYTLLSLVHGYNRISISDLRRYLELLHTPANQRFYDITLEGISDTAEAALRAYTERLAVMLSP